MNKELAEIYTYLNKANNIAKLRPEYFYLFNAIEHAFIQLNQIDILDTKDAK